MKTFIYQDLWSKRISKLLKNEPQWKVVLEKEEEYLIDCDEDSILILKNLPPDPELGRIMSGEDVAFEQDMCPVIVQDAEGVVLMQAFVNQQALGLSFNQGYAHYYSRSRNKLWKKGEESGHLQKIYLIEYSPLYKYLVYRVEQKFGACHTGYYSCFYRKHTQTGESILYSEKSFEPEKVYVK